MATTLLGISEPTLTTEADLAGHTDDGSRSKFDKASLHELLERCAVCEGPFHLPKLLDCLHSVCEPCVKRCLSAGQDGAVVVCPVKDCGEQTCIPQGLISALPTNYLLLSSEKSTSGPCFCSECVDSEEAELHCVECSVFLCSFHVLSHRKSRSTTQHELQSIEEARAQRHSRKQRQHVTCPLHTQEMNFYCVSCDQLCCSQCHRGGHRGHSVAMATDVVDSLLGKLRKQMKDAASAISVEETEMLMADINARLDQLEDDAQAASEEINAAIGEAKKALDGKEKSLLKKVDELRSHRETELEQQLIGLQQTTLRVTMATSLAERVSSNLSPFEQLHLYPVLQKKLSQISKHDDWSVQKNRAKQVSSPRKKEIKVSKTSFCIKDLIEKIENNELGENNISNGMCDTKQTKADVIPVLTRFGSVEHRVFISCRDSTGDLLYDKAENIGLTAEVRSPIGNVFPGSIYCWRPNEDELTHFIFLLPLYIGTYSFLIKAQGESISGAGLHLRALENDPLRFTRSSANCEISDDGTTVYASNPHSRKAAAALGSEGITSGTLEWRIKLGGLSTYSSSFIRVGVAQADALRPGKGKRCIWSWCSNGRFVSHDATAEEDLGVDEEDFTSWKDGDTLRCCFCYSAREFIIVHEADETRSVISNMSLNGKEMFPYVSLFTAEHRVQSLSWMSMEK